MGLVISFPGVWRQARTTPLDEPATVVILPVVRIERPPEKKAATRNRPPTRRRKRPASRS